MSEWQEKERHGQFAEAEHLMLEETSGPAPYGYLLITRATFYERWGDALRPEPEAIVKYRQSHSEWAWFAAGSTSGGEGTARMLDVNRVLKKIDDLKVML